MGYAVRDSVVSHVTSKWVPASALPFDEVCSPEGFGLSKVRQWILIAEDGDSTRSRGEVRVTGPPGAEGKVNKLVQHTSLLITSSDNRRSMGIAGHASVEQLRIAREHLRKSS